mgnify:FL=1
MLLVVLIEPIINHTVFEVKPTVPVALPVFPEPLINVAIFLPDVLSVPIPKVVCPPADVYFLIFDECLLAYTVLHIVHLLALVDRVAYFVLHLGVVLSGLDAHAMFVVILPQAYIRGAVWPRKSTEAVPLVGLGVDLALV